MKNAKKPVEKIEISKELILSFCKECDYKPVSVEVITEGQDYYVVLNCKGVEVGFMVDINEWVALDNQRIPKWYDDDTTTWYWRGFVKAKEADKNYLDWCLAYKKADLNKQDEEYQEWLNSLSL